MLKLLKNVLLSFWIENYFLKLEDFLNYTNKIPNYTSKIPFTTLLCICGFYESTKNYIDVNTHVRDVTKHQWIINALVCVQEQDMHLRGTMYEWRGSALMYSKVSGHLLRMQNTQLHHLRSQVNGVNLYYNKTKVVFPKFSMVRVIKKIVI